jgi:PAS domain S-box-containing protein
LKNESRYRILLESVPLAVYECTADGRVTLANKAYSSITGYDENEILRMHIWDFMEPGPQKDDLPSMLETLVRSQPPPTPYECRNLNKDGRVIHVQVDWNYKRDEDGRVAGFVCVLSDVTERKKVEEALRGSERMLRESQEVALLGSYVLDIETGAWTSSKVLDDIFGIDEEYPRTVEGWANLIHPDFRRGMVDYFRRDVLHNHENFQRVYKIIRHKERQERWVHGLGELECDESGAPVRMIGTIQDVTDRKETEEALRRSEEQLLQAQKMEAVGRLAGGIAHDFNNLLTVISGYVDLMQNQVDPASQLSRGIKEIREATDRAALLTRQLLAFSRRQVLQPRVIDLNQVVTGLESLLKRLIGEDVLLVTSLSKEATHVLIDQGQIEQVIVNLAVNARDAMPKGGRLVIETERLEVDGKFALEHPPLNDGPHVRMVVSDTGVGMDRETQSRIFEPFFTTKEKGKGTGLGLSTAYGIITQSGGSVTVDSLPGGGTTFEILFPRSEKPPAENKEIAIVSVSSGGETILVVEDEPVLLGLVSEVLGSHGYEVLGAGNADEALNICRNGSAPVHLLVTDVIMPGMSGRDLAEQVAALHSGTKILFMSGYPEDFLGHHGVMESGISFLQKPFMPDHLLRKVREVLDTA